MTQNTKHQDKSQVSDDAVPIGALIRVVWRKKWWIMLCMILATSLGGYYAFKIAVPKYQATSVLLLDASDQQLLDLGAVLPSLGTSSETTNTEVEVLKSRRLIERVVIAADLTKDPEFNHYIRSSPAMTWINDFFGKSASAAATADEQVSAAISAVLKRLSVRNVPKTYVLEITLKTEAAEKSAKLVDIIAEQYVLYQMDNKLQATRNASEWLASRVADLKIDLEIAEAAVASYTTSSEVISEASVLALDRQLKEVRDRLVEMRATQENLESELLRLEALKTADPEEKVAQANDSSLRRIFQEVGDGDAFAARFSQLLNNVRLQVERTTAQVKALDDSIEIREAEIARQNGEVIQLQQLNREAEASRLLYEYFLGRLKETTAQEGIQRADSRILSYAVLPTGASEPHKMLILAVSLILGFAIGCGGALLWEMRQDTYRNATELHDDVKLPVFGQIPLIPVTNRRSSLDYLTERPTSAAAEAIRNLRTSVLLSNLDKAPKIIMSTSSLPGEGKTTMSFALAQSLVGLNKKILLIEGDMRRLVFSQYLDVKAAKGIMSVLSKDITLDDAVIHDKKLDIDILVGESSDVNAADILSSKRFKELLAEIREAYDFVIIDTPPVLVVPDARILAQEVDNVLFTVKWDSTTKTQVRNALDMFKTVDVAVDGLILNQINAKGMKRYGYGDSYGAYGSYGSKYYTN